MPHHRRTQAVGRAVLLGLGVVACGALSIRLLVSTPNNRGTLGIFFAVLLLVLVVATLVATARIPRPTVPRLPNAEDPSERLLLRRLSAAKWETAHLQAGTAIVNRENLDRTFIQTPTVTSVTSSPLGLVMEVKTVPGQSPKNLANRLDNLASALSVPLRLHAVGASTVEITAQFREPLNDSITVDQFSPLDLDTMAVNIGVVESGEPWRWGFRGHGGSVVGGIPGSGKTSTMAQVAGPLLLSPYVVVDVIDGKGGWDWAWAAPLCRTFCREDEDLAVMAGVIRNFRQGMQERLRAETSGASNWWNRDRSTEEPFHVLFYDECQTGLSMLGRKGEEKALVEQMIADLEVITKKGRSAGYHVVLMTQKPTSDSIPTRIRDQAGIRVAFRVLTREAEQSILAEAPETEDDPRRATSIPDTRLGGAVLDFGDRRFAARAWYLPEQRAAELINQANSTETETEPEVRTHESVA